MIMMCIKETTTSRSLKFKKPVNAAQRKRKEKTILFFNPRFSVT
jgi:hypothetical protein